MLMSISRPRALTFFTTCATVAWAHQDEEHRRPGGNGCGLPTAGYANGVHRDMKIMADGNQRHFLLFVPSGYQPQVETPFWLLAPGAYETPARFLNVSGMLQFAEEKGIAFAVLQGQTIEGLNVGLHGLALPHLPDDISYTRAVLRDVSAKLCINMNRIRCTGYSRGARFCSRLASELSSFVKGIAPVAGIRFPNPNNATKKMPIIAIHGTQDRINPYWGKGDPSYWHASVPDAIHRWADFNGCKYQKWIRETTHVILSEHFDCIDDSSVVLVMIQGDGHTWPGSNAFVVSQFGPTTQERRANDVMFNFFMRHPSPSKCHTAHEGELCYTEVQKAIREGPKYGAAHNLTTSSSFEDYQTMLHFGIWADCPRPCDGPSGVPTVQEVLNGPSQSVLDSLQGMMVSPTPAPTKAVLDELPARLKVNADSASSSTSTLAVTQAVVTTLLVTTTTQVPTITTTPVPTTRTNTIGDVEAVEGHWMRNTDPGRFVEVIKDGMIHWDVGPVTKIRALGDAKFSTVWQGSTYHAHLVRGQLVWDDGDVWVRVKVREAADNVFARKDEQYNDLARSWLSQPSRQRGTVLFGLVAIGLSAISAAAAFSSLRARRLRHMDNHLPTRADGEHIDWNSPTQEHDGRALLFASGDVISP